MASVTTKCRTSPPTSAITISCYGQGMPLSSKMRVSSSSCYQKIVLRASEDSRPTVVIIDENVGKAGDGFCEPCMRVGHMWNPLTIPRRIYNFLCQLVDFLSRPSWNLLSEKFACQTLQRRPMRLNPSYQDCVDHNAACLQVFMGMSCLVFFLPLMVYLWCADSSEHTQCKFVALCMSIFLCYISTISFIGDYWYTGDAPATGVSPVPECQKQYIFNAIDMTNIPFAAIIVCTVSLGIFLFAPQMNWVQPVVFGIWVVACFIQQFSLRAFKVFSAIAYANDYDRSDPSPIAIRALARGLYLHIIWHILGAIPVMCITYCLVTYGVSKPHWMSY